MFREIIFCFCIFTFYNLNAQFELITTNTTQSLNFISIKDSNILVGGNYSHILKTSDLFQSSQILDPPLSASSPCTSYRIDTNILYSYCKVGFSTIIYKSMDQGLTWELKLNIDSLGGHSFKMFDSLNGILLCSLNKCLITNDGGDTWYSRNLFPSHPFYSETYGDSIICASGMNGFTISDDRGTTWVGTGVNADNGIQNSFQFLNKDTIYALTRPPAWDPFLSYSLNHGQTWTNKYFTGDNRITPYDVYFLTVDEGYVVGDRSNNCRIMKTLDRGETWEIIHTGFTGGFFRIEFANDSIAFIGGTNGLLIKWNKNTQISEVLTIDSEQLGIRLYPNPATTYHELEIQTKGFLNLEITLLDAQGKQIKHVLESKINQEKFTFEKDISHLSSGAYFYKVKLDNVVKTLKFVKD
jgi:photosystem II stability/assembly factor-like uncharacterized protein